MSAIVVLSQAIFDEHVLAYLVEQPSDVYAPDSARFVGAPGVLSARELTFTPTDLQTLGPALEEAHAKIGIDFVVLSDDAFLAQGVGQWASSRRIPVFAQGSEVALLRQARAAAAARNLYAWQEMSKPSSTVGKSFHYYGFCRSEVLEMISHQPRVVVEAGCGGGATGAELKVRFPNAKVIGVELNADAAQIASHHLDRVICANIETLDFAAEGFEPNSVDTVIFADVLEHLYDPWHLLDRLKAYLAPDAHIIASIPNVRNFWLIEQLIRGNWDYVAEGLLDVTHIRFFTRKSVQELFEQTGYRIRTGSATRDGRIPPMTAPKGQVAEINNPFLAIKQQSQADLDELGTMQFLVDAVLAT